VRAGFWAALFLTVVTVLSPRPSAGRRGEAVEIGFMGPGGPISGAMEDAVREFERVSRERHERDPSYPIYRVVSGQNASRSQTEDPTRFLISLAGGMPPDVIIFDRYAISEWAVRGVFTPLDDFIKQDADRWDAWRNRLAAGDSNAAPPWAGALQEQNAAAGAVPRPAVEPIRPADFYRACWDEAVVTDPVTGSKALYGIPSSVDNRCLLYNADLLIKYGYTNGAGKALPPSTWEELEAMATAMTERDAAGRIKRIGFIPNYGNSWLYIYGWQAGGEFMSADGRKCTLNDPNIATALEFMTRVYDSLGGAREVYAFQTIFQGGELDPFIQGKVAMKVDGSWQMNNLAMYGQDLNFGVAPAPLPRRELEKGRHPISWTGGWAYAIPSTAREKRGAWELIRFLMSRRAVEITLTASKLASESQGRIFIPPQFPRREQNDWVFRQYVDENPLLDVRFKAGMKTFNDMLEHSRYRPVTPVGQKLWNAHIWAMEDAIFHKKAPAEALNYYTAVVQRDLDAVLRPSRGLRIGDWTWFIVLYGIVIAAAVVVIYRRDTRETRRGSGLLARAARVFRAGEETPQTLAGVRTAYFRAQWREGLICALPWIIGFVVFTGGPLLFSIVISFCRYDIINDAVWVGGENYAVMLTKDELFWKSLANTVFMVIGIPLGMALSLGIALLLNLKVRGIAVWRTFFYLPSIVPAVASSILWIWILNPQSGLLNGMLGVLGVHGPNWLQDEATSKWALIVMGLWGAGGGMIIWLAGLKGISDVYYEAAAIDGASAWQRFTRITIPMLTPYIFFNLVMGLIGTFQIFSQAFIMTQGGPVNSTLFYAYHLFNNAFRYMNMGYAAAMAWFLFLIVVGLTAVQMKVSNRWVHYEGD
jgi:multiple sugar transport system permease protein